MSLWSDPRSTYAECAYDHTQSSWPEKCFDMRPLIIQEVWCPMKLKTCYYLSCCIFSLELLWKITHKAVAGLLEKPGLFVSGLKTTVMAGGIPGDFSQSWPPLSDHTVSKCNSKGLWVGGKTNIQVCRADGERRKKKIFQVFSYQRFSRPSWSWMGLININLDSRIKKTNSLEPSLLISLFCFLSACLIEI